MKKLTLVYLFFLVSFNSLSQATDTLRVVSYNLLKFPFENSGRISLIENIMAEAKPDILMVCELTSASGATGILNNALNQNGVTHYEMATYIPGTDTENMVYYNSDKLSLLEENVISTDLRDINEYVLFYNSTDLSTTLDTTFFYVFVCHLKAGQSDSILRNEMAIDMKEYMANRGPMENVLVGGDFNVYGSSEPVWNTVLTGSGVELVDPINTPGEWHNDWGYASIHTQSTRTTSVDGGATGGMDDRFDLIFMSQDLQNWGAQAKYIEGSYWAYGQDGLHFNLALTDAPANSSLPSSIIQDLYDMSDHLPVYMEIAVQTSFNSMDQFESSVKAVYDFEHQVLEITNSELAFEFRRISVYDVSGRLILTQPLELTGQKVDVSTFDSGIYILTVDDTRFYFKFKK